jgi:hypothetical protein
MAPVLQCPDCGEKHPLAQVPTHGAFPCRGCGRVLKVPEVVTQRAGAPSESVGAATAAGPVAAEPEFPAALEREDGTPDAADAERPVPVASAVAHPLGTDDPMQTRAIPAVDEQALGALSPRSRRPVARLGHVPWWMRLFLWIIAVPVGFLLVFVVARAFKVFSNNDLSDLFLANGTSRFWPVARLLPFVALVTATFVQVGVYLLARLRGRRHGAAAGDIPVPVSRSRGR